MRFVDPPTLASPWREQPGDDLDGLLTAFFRSEMPSPWPGAPEPEEADLVLRDLFKSRSDLVPDMQRKTVTVRLHARANGGREQALRHLCSELSATETVFPGTDLELIYELSTPD